MRFSAPFLILALAAAASADTQKGIEAFRQLDYDVARAEFEKAAAANDAVACYWLGEMCSRALGFPLDFKAAAKWWARGADLGNADSQQRLGNFYRTGVGVRLDEKKALDLLRRAADQGHRGAMLELSALFRQENGPAFDLVAAYSYLMLAAEQGRPEDRDSRDEIIAQLSQKQRKQARERCSAWARRLAKTVDVEAYSERWFAMLGSDNPVPAAYVIPDDIAKHIDALLAMLGDKNEEMRGRAAGTLADQVHFPNGLPLAKKVIALLESESPHKRAGAVSFLREVGSRGMGFGRDELIAALKDPDAMVRIEAIKELGALGPAAEGAIPHLIRAMKLVGSRSSAAASVSLARIGAPAAPELVKLLNDDRPRLQTRVVEVLGLTRAAPELAVPAMLELLQRNVPTMLQLATLRALREYGAAATKPLIAMLNAKTSDKRARGLDLLYLVDLAAPEAVPVVVELLRQDRTPVRRRAAQALGRVGRTSPAAVPALQTALADEEPEVQRAAIVALGELAPHVPAAFKALAALSSIEKDDAMRATVVAMLGHKRMTPRAKEVLPFLEAALKDKASAVVANAVMGFGQIGAAARASIPALNAAREREDLPDWIRGEIEVALEGLQLDDAD